MKFSYGYSSYALPFKNPSDRASFPREVSRIIADDGDQIIIENGDNLVARRVFPTPIPQAGLVAIFDASQQETVTYDGSNRVSVWEDAHGSNHDAENADLATQPEYDPATESITFDLTQFLIANNLIDVEDGDYTVAACVYASTGAGNAQNILSTRNGAWRACYYNRGRPALFHSKQSGDLILGTEMYDQRSVAIWRYTHTEGAKINAYYDGTSSTTSNPDFSGYETDGVQGVGRFSGSSGFLLGNMYEIIVYNRGLSDQETDTLGNFLKLKWIQT